MKDPFVVVAQCNCGQGKLKVTLDGTRTVYDLNFGWTCPYCSKVNSFHNDIMKR